MRLAWKYNKTVARPRFGMNFDIHKSFKRKMVRPIVGHDKSYAPSILTQHTKFSQELDQMYPKSKAYRFSILRGNGIIWNTKCAPYILTTKIAPFLRQVILCVGVTMEKYGGNFRGKKISRARVFIIIPNETNYRELINNSRSEPSSHFSSLFNFMRKTNPSFGRSKTPENFLNNPGQFM